MNLKRLILAGAVAGMVTVAGCASNTPENNHGNRNGERLTDNIYNNGYGTDYNYDNFDRTNDAKSGGRLTKPWNRSAGRDMRTYSESGRSNNNSTSRGKTGGRSTAGGRQTIPGNSTRTNGDSSNRINRSIINHNAANVTVIPRKNRSAATGNGVAKANNSGYKNQSIIKYSDPTMNRGANTSIQYNSITNNTGRTRSSAGIITTRNNRSDPNRVYGRLNDDGTPDIYHKSDNSTEKKSKNRSSGSAPRVFGKLNPDGTPDIYNRSR